jgi:catechol 2,3-dioxygenase-like lactoylglutathione lyase family enzyme
MNTDEAGHGSTRTRAALAVVALFAVRAFGQAPHAQAPERLPITGVDHVALRVGDVGAARAFYADLLGLPESTGGFGVGARQRILVEGGLGPEEDERLLHLAFATTNANAIAARLRDAGFSVSSVDAPACGGRVLRTRDPDGHTIEFVEREVREAPAATPSRALSSRILHAGLTVANADAADRFYKEALGFSELWRGGRTDAETDWINMRVPEGTDYLEYMLVRGPVDRRQRGVLHHICLLVPDIQAAYESALARTPAARRAAVGPPSVGRNRRWQLNLYDPDGTRTELMEPHTMR